MAEPSKIVFDDTPGGTVGNWLNDRRFLVRVVLATLVAIGVNLLIWSQRSTTLPHPIVAMGYPSYANYDFLPTILKYRLEVAGFPAVLALTYLALDWIGPFASRPRWQWKKFVPLVVTEPEEEVAERRTFSPGDVWRVLVPLLLVAISVRSRTPNPAAFASGLRLLFIVLYVGAVAGATWLLSRNVIARARGWTAAECFCVASAVLEAVAAFGGLWFVSHRTGVQFQNGKIQAWPWIPWWFSVLGVLLSLVWIARRLRSGARPESVERIIRVVLVGSAIVYLFTVAIPGPISQFIGYDDAQSLTGAALLQHGYFPWKGFQIIHGPFVDIFEALIGWVLFQHSAWGQAAAGYLVLAPATYVCFYLLAAWATRCRSVIVVAPVLFFGDSILGLYDARLFPLPLMLILLGQTFRSGRRRWMVGLTLAMVVGVILVPETVFQAVPIAFVVVAADLVHRNPGESLLKCFRRTRIMVITGVIASAVWMAFLAAEGAAGAFIQWYDIFIPGHIFTGTTPQSAGTPYTTMFVAVIVVTVLTLLAAAWRIYRQLSWTPLAWAGLAAALNAAIYGEQALMRPDAPHFVLSIEGGTPLLIIAGAAVIPAMNRRLGVVVSFARSGLTGVVSRLEPLGLACLTAMLVFIPGILPTLQGAPSKTAVALGPIARNSPFGYATTTLVDADLYPDLKKIMKTYVPPGKTFYDMTAAPGWYYYLLGMRPTSSLTNITQADTSSLLPSNLIISALKRKRPPLISFADWVVGLPDYDGLLTEVRDYVVSQYVLDHYTPIFVSHTIIFMARNDLIPHLAPIPHLSQPPITTNLYNQLGTCNWGDSANYLPSPQVGPSVTIPAAGSYVQRTISVQGWAYDQQAHRPPKDVVVVVKGHVVFTVPTGQSRPDVAKSLQTQTASTAGYSGTDTISAGGPVSVYEVGSDGELHGLEFDGRVPSGVKTVQTRRGQTLEVGAAATGFVDSMTVTPAERVSSFHVPAGTSLKSVRLVTFHAAQPFGNSSLSLSDSPNFSTTTTTAFIVANTLPLASSRLAVRVGACLQWHGYTGKTLYVQEPTNGSALTSITLSGVKNVS